MGNETLTRGVEMISNPPIETMSIPVFQSESTCFFIPEGDPTAAQLANNAPGLVFAWREVGNTAGRRE